MRTIAEASKMAFNQYMNRRPDERLTSLTALDARAQDIADRSRSAVVSTRDLQWMPDSDLPSADLVIAGPNGSPSTLTNWSFGQMARLAGGRADYLGSLPAALAADCLNWGFHHANEEQQVGVLLTRDTDTNRVQVRAATGPKYGRITNATVTAELVRRFGDGLTGDWRIPLEFGKEREVTTQNTSLYLGDRSMFVFLSNERNKIEIPNRRNGKPGLMSSGIYIWNSEVGNKTLGFGRFFFDYACSNFTVHGMEEYYETSMRHTASAPGKWLSEVAPQIESIVTEDATPLVEMIKTAQAAKITDKVGDFLATRFTKRASAAMQSLHLVEEGRPIESLWDASVGATAYARSIPFADERVAIEREAGKLLKLAA